MTRDVPIPDSYWLIDGLLLAGEYPGKKDLAGTRTKVQKFLDAGIRTFVDLTEQTGRLTQYDAVLGELSAEQGLETRYIRHGIRDLGVPDTTLMTAILDTIREEMAAGRPVYVHCWGGVGRTGTVIGCWLVEEEGLSGREAIEKIAQLRKGTPDGYKRAPETDAQRRYVSEWRAAK